MSLDITPEEVNTRRTNGDDFILLDCREPEELAIASLAGATHIPMGDIPQRITELNPDDEIIVFCHHGIRSAAVCSYLRQLDFGKVKNLRGGIDAWSRRVDAGVPVY